MATGGQIVAAFALGLTLGIIGLVASPVTALVAVLGVIVLAIAFTYPELIILAVLALASGLFPSRFNPYIDIVVGNAQLSDVLLIGLLFIVVFRVISDRGFQFIKTPLDLPIILFFGAVLAGLVNAVLRFDIRFSAATYEFRVLMYYLLFFAITNLVRTKAQLVRLVYGVMAIGFLLAVVIIAQSSLFGSVLAEEKLVGQADAPIRVFHPGLPLAYVVLITLVGYIAMFKGQGFNAHRWSIALVIVAALLVTATRHIFVSLALVIGLLIVILSTRERARLLRTMIAITIFAAGFISLLALAGLEAGLAEYSVTSYVRLQQMFSRGILSSSGSLGWRWQEIQYAWSQISEHPILGIGLNSPYRPPFYPGEAPGLLRYIHNAYFSLWLKTGIVGLVTFLWFSIIFIRKGLQNWRRVKSVLLRAVVIGFTVGYAGMMLSNLVAPSMVRPGQAAIFGVILGLGELILVHAHGTKGNVPDYSTKVFQSSAARS